MRITLHLDTFDNDPCAYAILWLDDKSLRWSREAHAGLTLPRWGLLRSEPDGTLISGPSGTRPLSMLEGLSIGRHGGPLEGETGRACLYAIGSIVQASGHWHVQCVDNENTEPEFSVFADDEAA